MFGRLVFLSPGTAVHLHLHYYWAWGAEGGILPEVLVMLTLLVVPPQFPSLQPPDDSVNV